MSNVSLRLYFRSFIDFAALRLRRFGGEASASASYVRSGMLKVFGRSRMLTCAARIVAIALGTHIMGCWAVATVWILKSGFATGLGIWDLLDRFNIATVLISPILCYPYLLLFNWTKDAIGPRHLLVGTSVLGWGVYVAPTIAIWATIRYRRVLKRHRERVGRFCRVCNYDLRASIGRCPECGTPCDDRRPMLALRLPPRPR